MTNNSILPPEARGVVFVTGPRGIGKTFFVSMIENPALVAFFDFEAKGEGVHGQLSFGAYYPVTEMAAAAGGGPLRIWQEVEQAIKNMPKDRFTVAVIDNVSPLELALNAEANRDVVRYVSDFGLNLANVRAGRYGGLKSVVNFLITEKACSTLHAKGIQLIAVTSHVKAPWVGGVPVINKWRPLGADRWQELSIMTLILVPGDKLPIPSAIVQKEQLGGIRFSPETGDFESYRRLPLRLPEATFAAVKHYLANPANLSDPLPGEVPSEDEMATYGERLSREQIAMIKEIMRSGSSEDGSGITDMETIRVVSNPVVDNIRLYLSQNPDATDSNIKANVEGATRPLILQARQ